MSKKYILSLILGGFIFGFVGLVVVSACTPKETPPVDCIECIVPSIEPSIEVSPEVTVEPSIEATPEAQPTQEPVVETHGDGKSDGQSSCPDCTKAPTSVPQITLAPCTKTTCGWK